MWRRDAERKSSQQPRPLPPGAAKLWNRFTFSSRRRGWFNSVSYLAIGDDGVLGPCHVVYVDSEMFYLLCGPKADRKEIVRKDSVDRYVLE